ncbi:MAG: glycosyltransferase family 39 protein [Chitinophagaceae bacterium]
MKHYSINLEREDLTQYITGFFCLFVYAGSLMFPLMDKDAAHHANIALHMLETNDYASLVDRQLDYLDKPHFLFWSSAISFKIFGINTFAHRLPAILFGLVSIFSAYRLTLHLSNKTTAKIAAIMLATAEGFIISINDARMETPLASAIIFGLWHLVVYVDKQKFLNLVFAALGAAIAFSTKGWIGVLIIFTAAFFYILTTRKWSILANMKTWLFIPLFFIFISPVLYAYYLQYDLHPEKNIRGMTNISGIKFILWDQNFERFKGDSFSKGGRNSSYVFLYHTFLWAFFPWCIAAYMALLFWFKRILVGKKINNPFNFAALAFGLILFTISFSKFKMPHYIFMLLPMAAVFTAPYLRLILSYRKGIRFFYGLHLTIGILVVLALLILNYYFFQPLNWFVQVLGPLAIIAFILFMVKKQDNRALKVIYTAVFALLLFNFFLNYNFFPNLFRYQGGNELVKLIEEKKLKLDDNQIVLLDNNAHSFDFYRGTNHRIADPVLMKQQYDSLKENIFLINTPVANQLIADGFKLDTIVSHPDYNVSTMKLKFLNPSTRISKVDTIMLARIYK